MTKTGVDSAIAATPEAMRSVDAARVRRRAHADGDADGGREDGGGDDQLQRARQAQRHLLGDRRAVLQRHAEIAAHEAGQIVPVLHVDRRVEAQLLPQRGDGGGVRRGAPGGEEQLGRIPRHQVQEQEDDGRHQPHHEDGDADPLSHIGEHQSIAVSSSVRPE